MRTPEKVYDRRLTALKKRRNYLDERISSSDKDLAYDKAEASAIDWALAVIERNYKDAIDVVREQMEERENNV